MACNNMLLRWLVIMLLQIVTFLVREIADFREGLN